MSELSDKQRIFLERYLQSWNATEAAQAAQYANPGQQGYRLLKNVQIASAIRERIGEQAMAAGEVLQRLAEQARSTMADFVTIGEIERTIHVAGETLVTEKVQRAYIDLERAEKHKKLHLLKKVKEGKDGSFEIELLDAQSALVHLGKHHGLFVERQEITGKNGEAIEVTVQVKGYGQVSPDEWPGKGADGSTT